MTNNDLPAAPSTDALLFRLLRLIGARADGDIAGPSVDAKIDELFTRLADRGAIVEVAIAKEAIWKND